MRWLILMLAVLAVPAQADTIKPFVRGSWKTLQEANKGQPVVVHFWGVTCGPCMAELPQWGKLLQDNPDMKLLLVEADLVSESPERVAQIMTKAGLTKAESWAFADYFDDRLRYEIDPSWQGELPRTVLIAGDGSMETLPGSGELPKVRAWTEKHHK